MKIKDLMALNLFKECKLLTKNIGLENTISSAMVLEARDIENWTRKNQLIMTSFYALKDASNDEIHVFFQKMKKIGISGLAIKMDRLITIIPDWLIQRCFEYEIPLIKVPEAITYEKIMITIYEPILNQQEHLLRTYYDVRQKFTKVERNLRSFEQIMETFYQLIKVPCMLKIDSLGIEIHYGGNFDNYVVSQHHFLQTTEFTKNLYEKLTLFSQEQNQQITALKTEIFSPLAQKCTLSIYQESTEVKQSDLMIIENVTDLIQEKLQMESILKKERYARMNNLADAILQNTPKNADELNSLLDEANINSSPYYQGIAFICPDEEKRTIDETVIAKKLRRLRKLEIYFDHYNYTVVLFNLKSESDAVTKKEIKQLFTEKETISKQFHFSLSQIKKKSGLKEILFECLDTLRFNRSFFIDYVISVKDLGIFRFFMQEDQFRQLETIIPEELTNLRYDNKELFDTLHTFFKTNRNYKQTAETLFLHPKTIRYRLNKVEELLRIDLTNPIQLVNYEIGTYLLSMKRSSTNE
ncbi:PucR family transcriptional regulator [Tetragenococcus muriaticus]|uniref:PucR family transcriptional regulator n=1 Tax=Tetragenococcus muriaticus TaxID=64642 RepID=UPI000418976C|nr:PucR family transcriptional regulator [Tetragenococcus muriaticus]GMA46463.1 purine catabolism regulatory protein [Tetragenococcus muriaticus]